jgi:hypothetical protein
MMHGRGKSDSAIVAVKPVNNAEQSAAELVERRAETKGNANQQSTCRTQIYEEDFLGISYGFRPGRSTHAVVADAVDRENAATVA